MKYVICYAPVWLTKNWLRWSHEKLMVVSETYESKMSFLNFHQLCIIARVSLSRWFWLWLCSSTFSNQNSLSVHWLRANLKGKDSELETQDSKTRNGDNIDNTRLSGFFGLGMAEMLTAFLAFNFHSSLSSVPWTVTNPSYRASLDVEVSTLAPSHTVTCKGVVTNTSLPRVYFLMYLLPFAFSSFSKRFHCLEGDCSFIRICELIAIFQWEHLIVRGPWEEVV